MVAQTQARTGYAGPFINAKKLGVVRKRETGEWREGGRHLNCFEGILNDLGCVVSYALGLEKC